MGQHIQFAWEVTVSLWDLCMESARGRAAMGTERGSGWQSGFGWALCEGIYWGTGSPGTVGDTSAAQSTCLGQTGTHPHPSETMRSTGVTQADRGRAFTLITVFTSKCTDFRDFLHWKQGLRPVLLAGTPREFGALWWPAETTNRKLQGKALVPKCHR